MMSRLNRDGCLLEPASIQDAVTRESQLERHIANIESQIADGGREAGHADRMAYLVWLGRAERARASYANEQRQTRQWLSLTRINLLAQASALHKRLRRELSVVTDAGERREIDAWLRREPAAREYEPDPSETTTLLREALGRLTRLGCESDDEAALARDLAELLTRPEQPAPRASHDQLAKEAAEWDATKGAPPDWKALGYVEVNPGTGEVLLPEAAGEIKLPEVMPTASEIARLRNIEKAARAWYKAQRGTMASLSPTGLRVRDALGEKEAT